MANNFQVPTLSGPVAGHLSSDSGPAGEQEEKDAILRVCSYHRRDYDLVLIRSPPHEMQPVQDSIQEAFEARPSQTGLGSLDHLPVELMTIVLRKLDVLSYFRFRQVNNRARALSTSLWEYNLVARHGLEGLRGLLRAKIAHHFTINDLYLPLITSNCECGAFGGFLFLPTVARYCFTCIWTRPDLRLLSESTFARLTKISTTKLRILLIPILSTVPGTYSMMDIPVRRPKCLIARTQAVAALRQYGVFTEEKAQRLERRSDQESYRFMASTAFPWLELGTGRVEHGVNCKGCQVRAEDYNGSYEDCHRVFSAAGFLTHFTHCVEAQNLWAESQGGTRSPAEPEITRRGGTFARLGPDGLPR